MFSKYKERKRAMRYCHHEQPCWCGRPLDPDFIYSIDMMGGSPSEMTDSENARMRQVVAINRVNREVK